jgi:hypothetical protein
MNGERAGLESRRVLGAGMMRPPKAPARHPKSPADFARDVPRYGHVSMAFVHPDMWERGVGRQLPQGLHERASAATKATAISPPWWPIGNLAVDCLIELFRCYQHHGLRSGASGGRSSQAQRRSRHFIGHLADHVKIGCTKSVVADLNVTTNAFDHRSNRVAARGSSFGKETLRAACGVTDLPEIPGHWPLTLSRSDGETPSCTKRLRSPQVGTS